MTRKALYAGTFDPITIAHVDIIERAAALFDELIVGVAVSERKAPQFDFQRRLACVIQATAHLSTVTVVPLETLTLDLAKVHQVSFLVRGLRTASDFEYEVGIAQMNSEMTDHSLETVFLPARPELSFISSSMVRELILLKAHDQLARFLPACVLEAL